MMPVCRVWHWQLCTSRFPFYLIFFLILKSKLIGVWLSDAILLFLVFCLSVCTAIRFFGQELKAHVKWCDVRVGANRWCCCEWPLDVTCQWACKRGRDGGREGWDRTERGEAQDRAGRTTLALIQLLQAEQHCLREVGRGGSGESK